MSATTPVPDSALPGLALHDLRAPGSVYQRVFRHSEHLEAVERAIDRGVDVIEAVRDGEGEVLGATRCALLSADRAEDSKRRVTMVALRWVAVTAELRTPGLTFVTAPLDSATVEHPPLTSRLVLPALVADVSAEPLPPPGRLVSLALRDGDAVAAARASRDHDNLMLLLARDRRIRHRDTAVTDLDLTGPPDVMAALLEVRSPPSEITTGDEPPSLTAVCRRWVRVLRLEQADGLRAETAELAAPPWHDNRLVTLDAAAVALISDIRVATGESAELTMRWDVDTRALGAAYSAARRLVLLPARSSDDEPAPAQLVELLSMAGSAGALVRGLGEVVVAGLLQVHPYCVVAFGEVADVITDTSEQPSNERLERRLTTIGDAGGELHLLAARLRRLPLTTEAERLSTTLLAAAQLPADRSGARQRLALLADLPWPRQQPQLPPLHEIRARLDSRLAHLDSVKRRLIEGLASTAVWQRESEGGGPPPRRRPVLLVGPPGVGKTAIARAMATALELPLVPMAVTSVWDPTFLHGRDPAFAGAGPGRILRALAGTGGNLLMLLDELDKVVSMRSSNPYAELLSLADPDGDHTLRDDYLGLDIDTSGLAFVATANALQAIDAALLDRFDVIRIEGYTKQEKRAMLVSHIIPAELAEHGTDSDTVVFLDDALDLLVEQHSLEPGVRRLQAAVTTCVRRALLDVLEGDLHIVIGRERAAEYLADIEFVAHDDVDALRHQLLLLPLPAEGRRMVDEMLERLAATPQQSADHAACLTWLRTVTQLPWGTPLESPQVTLVDARAALDATHSGMEPVKRRILDQVTPQIWWGHRRRDEPTLPPPAARPLLLVGPPGTGKTSILQSIARAADRECSIIDLAGMSGNSLRGFERTYIGSQPGVIIDALRRAASTTVVLGLDEIDKMRSGGWDGDPYAVLMEITDPVRAGQFTDNFLRIPVDLSTTWIVATANQIERIPAALLDRFVVVELRGYSHAEKLRMLQQHLLPAILGELSVPEGLLALSDAARDTLITGYTYEAGVRGLEHSLQQLIVRSLGGMLEQPMAMTLEPDDVVRLMGPPTVHRDPVPLLGPPGTGRVLYVVTSLASGRAGAIEASLVPALGEQQLVLTGSVDDTIRESAQVGLAHVRLHLAELGIDSEVLDKHAIHIHFDGIGVPKSGPSAGVAIAATMVSALRDEPLAPFTAATGELTLDGRVLVVGGVLDKVIAAHRAGLTTVLIPANNAGDVVDLPEDVRAAVAVVPVATFAEALSHLLPPRLAESEVTPA